MGLRQPSLPGSFNTPRFFRSAFAFLTLVLAGCQSPPALSSVDRPSTLPSDYTLVWQDEFEQDGRPDHRKWRFDTGGNGQRWHNGEAQFYTRNDLRNAFVQDGILTIQAREGPPDVIPEGGWVGQGYTSARLITRRTRMWTYGFFEIRAKLPCDYGTWPALWLLGVEPGKTWPAVGEIDILEHVGQQPGVVHATVHSRDYNHRNGGQRSGQKRVADVCAAFHRYQLHWTPEDISIGIDDHFFFTLENDGTGKGSWPFDNPHYLIMNLAIGGWGGKNESRLARTEFPQQFDIDYVRVFQKTGDTPEADAGNTED